MASGDFDDQTDESLMVQARQGSTAAFEALVKRYRQELFHFLVRFLGQQAAGEDVFQDTFLQIHISLDKFQADRRFRPWLFTIAANKARDYLRRNKRTAALPLSAMVGKNSDGDETAFIDLMEADLPSPEEVASEHELQASVKQVVDGLPTHLREIILLAYFHQFPYQQIADILKIPLGTVKSRLHAAVGTFAKAWKSQLALSQTDKDL